MPSPVVTIKSSLGLRRRLVMLVVAALVPMAGLLVVNARLNANTAIDRTTDSLQFAAGLVAASQARVVDSAHHLLRSLANVPALLNANQADCQRELAALRGHTGTYANLGIINPDGHMRCHALDTGQAGIYVGDREHVQAALAGKQFTLGGYTEGRASGKPVITFTLPVTDDRGRVTALLFAAMDVNEISTAVGAASLPAGGQVAVMDANGIVLAASPANPAWVGKPIASLVVREAVQALRTGVGSSLGAEDARQLFVLSPTHATPQAAFFVAVSADREGVLLPVRRQFGLEMLVLGLVALMGGCLAWAVAGRAIMKPTVRIVQATQQFERGELDARIAVDPQHATGELTAIADAFNRMAQSLQTQQGALDTELQNSRTMQKKLRDAQRLARIGYWQLDLATKQLHLSGEIFDFLGIDAVLFEGDFGRFLTRVHQGDRAAFESACDSAIQDDADLDIEFRVVLQGGNICWIHHFGLARPDGEPGQGACLTGVIQDITARKHVELVTVRSTELLNRAGALAKVGGWEWVVDSMAPCWSEETYRIHGITPGVDVSFDEAVRYFAVDARPAIQAAVRAAVQEATPWDLELPLVTAKAQQIWVRIQGRAVVESGKVVRLMGVMQDITDRHAAQAHARLLQTCISRLNDIVMITEAQPIDEPGPRIAFVNDAFARQTGYSREEVLGKSPRFLQGTNTQKSELDRISKALKQWQPVRSEVINYTKSGQEIWLDLDIVPIGDEYGRFTHWVSVSRDITQRKRAEQALISSEQRYAALFHTAPVPMWVYDIATTRYLAVNEATVRTYGYSNAEFLAMTIFDVRPEAEHAQLRQWLSDPLPKNAVWHDRRKDGSIFPVELVSQPIQYAGQDARFVITLDKTVQEKAEKAVQDYLFTLQRAADAAQAITWHQTLEGTMQEIADQARGVIGAHQAAVSLVADSPDSQTIHALSLSEKYESYRGLLKLTDGSGIYSVVCENNRPVRLTQAELEAHPRWRGFGDHADRHPPMRGWLAVPLIGKNGKNMGLLQLSDRYEGEFTKQDEYVALELSHLASAGLENSKLLEQISRLNAGLEHKVAERTAALVHQEALFRALSEQAPQTVWTASSDGRAIYFNRAWFNLVGGELADWVGYQWLAAVHPEDVDDVKANWETCRASQSTYAGIRRLKASDGSFHTMAYRAAPVFDDQGAVAFWVGIDADITEIKATEAALRLSNQELEAFSYSVSHDLRSPLNTIDGFSRLLARQLSGDASPKVKHYLMRIQAGVSQMGQLIEDLLSLSQVTRATLHTRPIDLSLMALGLLNDWKSRQPERQMAITIEKGLQVNGDERLMRIAMENLLANAWKFTSQTAQAEISIGRQFNPAGLTVFFVKDNGAGFNMAYSDKLFNPFQRLHSASEFSGTGIGLATVSRVIKRHGGRIWAESVPTCGATFYFILP